MVKLRRVSVELEMELELAPKDEMCVEAHSAAELRWVRKGCVAHGARRAELGETPAWDRSP